MTGWVRVSRGAPCSICRKPDWCTVAADGSAACCMRVESDRRLGNGGWLHRLGRDMLGAPLCPARPPAPRRKLSAASLGNSWRRWWAETAVEEIDALAGRLGVTTEAMCELGACWAWPHEAWGFPMMDGAGEFVGIRLRSDEGEKWALRGGRQGIFTTERKPEGEVLVVEGPTDTAAALSLGFYAIGRPSCTGGAREVAAMCLRKGIKRVSVLADNDGPGIAGARAFCGQVGLPARLVVLPAKDLREWLKNGATRAAVEACLAAHAWK